MKNKKNSVLYIINVDWYFNLHWLERVEYFKSLGYEIHIITNFTDETIKGTLLSKGYICHDLNLKRKGMNLFSEFLYVLRLGRFLQSIKPNLIHSITIKPVLYSGLLNSFFYRKPIVYSITGRGAVFTSRKIKFVLLRGLIKKLYKFISINTSRFIFENEEDHLFFESVGILKYNNGNVIKGAGIDLGRFKPDRYPNNGSILFASRLLEDKGLRCLVDASRLLKARGYKFSLNVAGIIDTDVSSAIPLSQIEQWDVDGEINWLGNVKDMPSLINQNDVVCLPTTYGEGIPRILIEAAACGRCIITTDVPGCREVVIHRENGYLVPPNSAEDTANAIAKLLSEPELRVAMGYKSRIKAEREFDQNIVFGMTAQVYENILKS
ncbi:glycosyltransferase family 4 protein [Vibrio cholerae]|jgi:glycosyltransferase involved in cell wall biosynthesis|uniref:glycosyltransferase family 4 protein n=2 Tax=Vibrio cholerae TaxID=666 RepID=UPI0030F5F338